MFNAIVGVDVSKKDLSITMIVKDKIHYCNISNDLQGFKCFSKLLKTYKIIVLEIIHDDSIHALIEVNTTLICSGENAVDAVSTVP